VDPVFLAGAAVEAGPPGAESLSGAKDAALRDPKDGAELEFLDPLEVRLRLVVPREREGELTVAA
jgi:hypothetical protein